MQRETNKDTGKQATWDVGLQRHTRKYEFTNERTKKNAEKKTAPVFRIFNSKLDKDLHVSSQKSHTENIARGVAARDL